MEIRGLMQSLAMKHPGVELGVACKGTSIESTTYNTRNKAFLFVGSRDARLKRAVAGWIKIDLSAPPPEPELDSWIAESYELITSATPIPKPPPEKPAKPVRKPRTIKSVLRVDQIAESVENSAAKPVVAKPVAKAAPAKKIAAPKPTTKVAATPAKPVAKAAAKPAAKVAKPAVKPAAKPAKKPAAKAKKR